MKIKVSVIIPVYNMEKYLSECLESVLSQSISGLEVICIDDGSTDASISIVENYQKEYNNIILFKQNRKGSGLARNIGIENARGEFIAFMDSDDYYYSSDVLENLYKSAVLHNSFVSGGGIIKEIDGKKYLSERDKLKKYIFDKSGLTAYSDLQIMFGFQRFIYNRDFLISNNLKFFSYCRAQDISFLVRTLSVAKVIYCTDLIVYVYRFFDKRIPFEKSNVVIDIAKGHRDIAKVSYKDNYEVLSQRCASALYSYNKYFILHMKHGNAELKNLLEEIKMYLCNLHNEDRFFLPINQSIIDEYIDNEKKYTENIIEKIKGKQVIIYGAGYLGGIIYDFISNIYDIQFLGFAVTDKNPIGTLRGIKVKCIDKYLEYSSTAMVIIAVKGINNKKMFQTAKAKGFKDIITISGEIVNVDSFIPQ